MNDVLTRNEANAARAVAVYLNDLTEDWWKLDGREANGITVVKQKINVVQQMRECMEDLRLYL